DVCHNILRIVRRDAGTPTGTDTICPIDQDHRKDWAVPLRLDPHTIVVIVFQQTIVLVRHNSARKRRQRRENVTSARSILTSSDTRTKVTGRLEKIDIVRSDEDLTHVGDS